MGAFSAQAADADPDKHPLADIPLRHIGPAINSGRISDFAFHPQRKQEFYVATSSGNLWKTENNTITWQAIFDNEGAYALGSVTMAPSDPKIVWVGTGENNAQRSVGYGDGVYKSIDGGKSWQNMGLKDSGHISQIWIHPDDARHVLVAAQGPLWNSGGDRGLYRTTDGGSSWDRILEIDEDTGINEFVVDPRNPDVIVATSYQRRRHIWVLINGGPGSGIHKTTDGGASWREISSGLPKDHMGRIGLAMAPSEPDIIYAAVEANEKERGVYRSTDFGNNWEKRSSYMASSAMYYNELIVDPLDARRVYAMDTFSHISEDGGKTFERLGNNFRHVDDHALWIDPDDTRHLYIGGDGGIYESWDRGQTWRHIRNLSITQFYRIQPDNDTPYYNVCGGTQDNQTLCGPSRTTTANGITNADWHVVLGGDGYKPQFDPEDPNIIYTQYQYGNLYRYDRRTQERVSITPHPASGEPEYKWNWNTPILISPHDPHRLYYAAEYLFRSDDRGDSWRKVSPDLTRQLDRNQLKVMGRVWSIDAIAKNDSTSRWGSAIGLSESPLQEGLIYVGTDDGVINITEDDGKSWRREEKFRGVPDMSLVEDVVASVHDADVAYAVFDNHKRGDYRPYVLKTTNRGQSWTSIAGNLPARGSAHTIAEDHENPDLLFAGTEFGLFFTQDGGDNWHQLKGKYAGNEARARAILKLKPEGGHNLSPLDGSFPTIAVRDLEIQRRENDLVVGTFGRGIYIIDDYAALRTPASGLADAQLFPVRNPWLYVPGSLWDSGLRGSMGAEFFSAPNPPQGAVFSYYLRDKIKTRAKQRRQAEIEIEEKGGDTPYPDWDTVRAEDEEIAPGVFVMVRDTDGRLVRQVEAKNSKGLQRAAWDLRLPPPDPINLEEDDGSNWFSDPPAGPLVLPGDYSARLAISRDGVLQETGDNQRFAVNALENSPEITDDRRARQTFMIKGAALQRAVKGAVKVLAELDSRADHLRAALVQTPPAGDSERARLRELQRQLDAVKVAISGDHSVTSRNESAPMSIASRTNSIYTPAVANQAPVGAMLRESYAIAAREFSVALEQLRNLDRELGQLETELDLLGAPWTPGRVPQWSES
jgi:photosystem II stability/assembly factor-like uncharacterized protein